MEKIPSDLVYNNKTFSHTKTVTFKKWDNYKKHRKKE